MLEIQRTSLVKSIPAETIVLWEGEPNSTIHIVKSGWLKAIRSTPTGREQVISMFGPGDSFGVIPALSDTPNAVRVISLEACVIQTFPCKVIFEMLDQHPKLAHKLIARLSKSLAHLISLVEDLSLESVETRLVKFLIVHAEDGIYNRKKWETQDEIAGQIGTVPDVLSRILREFEKSGLITVNRNQIKLIDMPALEEKAKSGSFNPT